MLFVNRVATTATLSLLVIFTTDCCVNVIQRVNGLGMYTDNNNNSNNNTHIKNVYISDGDGDVKVEYEYDENENENDTLESLFVFVIEEEHKLPSNAGTLRI